MIKRSLTKLLVIILLFSICIGISIIYMDYYFSPTGGLATVFMFDDSPVEEIPVDLPKRPKFVPTGKKVTEPEALMQKVMAWADANERTVLFNAGAYAGLAFYSASDWLDKNASLSTSSRDVTDKIFVASRDDITEAHVSGDAFMPDAWGIEVAGYFDLDQAPPFLDHVDFLFPLALARARSGMFFIDSRDIDSFTSLIKSNGYKVASTRIPFSTTPTELIEKLLFGENEFSRSLFFSLIGLLFAYAYFVLISYRDNEERFWIHHLYGLSRKRMVQRILLESIFLIALSMLLFVLILRDNITYLQHGDMRNMVIISGILIILLVSLAHGGGYVWLSRRFNMREK